MSFIDDAARKVFLYKLETKDQALKAYEEFKAMAELQTGQKLKILSSDNGREYANSWFKQIMVRDGVRHQQMCLYTFEQNGIAERKNRTILDRVRSMLNDAYLPKRFRAEAVNTSAERRSHTRRSMDWQEIVPGALEEFW